MGVFSKTILKGRLAFLLSMSTAAVNGQVDIYKVSVATMFFQKNTLWKHFFHFTLEPGPSVSLLMQTIQ